MLPGFEYRGSEPDAFAPLAEVVDYIEGYAHSFGAPIRENVAARALRHDGERFVVETDDEAIEADNVVVASGAFQQPRARVPGAAPAAVDLQLTTSEYRRLSSSPTA